VKTLPQYAQKKSYIALRLTNSGCAAHHIERHLSEQNFFSFRLGIFSISSLHCLQYVAFGFGLLNGRIFFLWQWDFTVFIDIPSHLAISP
jgi:hypothetical protein